MAPITAVVVDDSRRARQAMVAALEALDGCVVAGEGANGLDALELAKARRPDVVVMGLRMPFVGGMEATRLLKRDYPRTHVVLVGTVLYPEVRRLALRMGATACLEKEAGLAEGLSFLVSNLVRATRPGAARLGRWGDRLASG